MENASKALIMAAGVLVAIMLISIGTYIFSTFSEFAKNTEEEIFGHQRAEFNSQFTQYETTSCTIYDIVSLANYAKNYNEKLNPADVGNLGISVMIGTQNIVMLDATTKNQLITNDVMNSTIPIYVVEDITYNNVTGLVKSIKFRKE